jgi:hypothetical protein
MPMPILTISSTSISCMPCLAHWLYPRGDIRCIPSYHLACERYQCHSCTQRCLLGCVLGILLQMAAVVTGSAKFLFQNCDCCCFCNGDIVAGRIAKNAVGGQIWKCTEWVLQSVQLIWCAILTSKSCSWIWVGMILLNVILYVYCTVLGLFCKWTIEFIAHAEICRNAPLWWRIS